MKKIEQMLIGITILLATILFHLAVNHLLLTDFIGIIGICVIISSYFPSDDDEADETGDTLDENDTDDTFDTNDTDDAD